MGQLILQVGGRAGRAEKSGTVIIQTEFSSHPLLKKLIDEGYLAFATELLKERQELLLPPYHFHVLIQAEAKESNIAHDFLKKIVRNGNHHASVNLLGPIPALMAKKAGRFRQLVILASENRSTIHQELDRLIRLAERSELSRKVRWSIDVDPVDLF